MNYILRNNKRQDNDSKTIYSVYTDVDNSKFYLFALDSNDGSLEWQYAISGANGSFTSPILDSQGNIYVTTNSKIYSISPSGSLLWSFSPYSQYSSSALWTRMPAIGKENGTEYIYITCSFFMGHGKA